MAAPNYGKTLGAVINLMGQRVRAQMLPSADGNTVLEVTGRLGKSLRGDIAGDSIHIGRTARIRLEPQDFKRGFVRNDGGVLVWFTNGSLLSVIPANDQEGGGA